MWSSLMIWLLFFFCLSYIRQVKNWVKELRKMLGNEICLCIVGKWCLPYCINVVIKVRVWTVQTVEDLWAREHCHTPSRYSLSCDRDLAGFSHNPSRSVKSSSPAQTFTHISRGLIPQGSTRAADLWGRTANTNLMIYSRCITCGRRQKPLHVVQIFTFSTWGFSELFQAAQTSDTV